MLRPCLTASMLLLFTASAAQAQISYSYLDGIVSTTSIETATGDADGKAGEVVFSYEILSFLYVFGGYEYSELDDFAVDGNLVQAGAGVHYDPRDNASIFFNLSGFTVEADTVTTLGTISADDDGYGYVFGYREISDNGRMEFAVSAEHQEFSDADTADTWLNLDLIFRVKPRFKILAGVSFAGDENAGRVGVRYYLPNRFGRD